jgi:hypothetical protein
MRAVCKRGCAPRRGRRSLILRRKFALRTKPRWLFARAVNAAR